MQVDRQFLAKERLNWPLSSAAAGGAEGRSLLSRLARRASPLTVINVARADARESVRLKETQGMTYKSILVHVEPNPTSDVRLALAVDLARRFEARLIGVGAQFYFPAISADASRTSPAA